MADSREQRAREMQLERWLQAFLGETGDVQQSDDGKPASPEVAELQAMAQRFRTAAQRIPLPEGQRALRKALVASAEGDAGEPATKRALPPRPWWAAAGAAAVLLLGVSIAGIGPRWGRVFSLSPRSGNGVAFEQAKVPLTPSSVGKAQTLEVAPRTSGDVRVPSTRRAVEISRRTVRATHTGPHQRTSAKYAVSFGKFFNRPSADALMHRIRSKGYIVYVAGIREYFWVVTRPYPTRAQAERLANALQEIGLPAQLTTAREWQTPYAGVSAGSNLIGELERTLPVGGD